MLSTYTVAALELQSYRVELKLPKPKKVNLEELRLQSYRVELK